MRQHECLAFGSISRVLILSSLPTLLGLSACNQAEFTGEAPRQAEAPEPVAKTFALGCDAADARERVDVKGQSTLTASVTGEVCLPGMGQATVLFVVDMSGSMGRHRRMDTGEVVTGNDPLQTSGGNESCGRLSAVTAVLNRLTSGLGTTASDVKVGMVAFAGDVLGERTVAPMPLADFRAALRSEQLCRYVVQSPSFGVHPTNPGGFESYVGSGTNYAAALNQAANLLETATSGRTVYFISDGEPTSAPRGQDPAASGIAAGERLRALGSDVVLNGLLLGADGAKAREIMTSVAGAATRVRVAAKADELADEVVQFPMSGLTPDDLQATLTGPDGVAQPVAIANLAPKGGDASGNVWTYTTADMTFEGAKGETSEHRLEVVARQELAGQISEIRSALTLEVARF